MACTGEGGPDAEPDRGELVAISITPFSPTLMVGGTQDFAVRGFYEDESSTLLDDIVWQVDDSRVAEVTEAGVVTALAEGSATLIASASDMGARTTVRVREPSDEPTLIEAVPASASLSVGESLSIQAVATYDDGDTGDIAAQCGWSTSDAAVATVDDGLVTAVRPGEATLTVDCGPRSPAPVSITVLDDNVEAPLPDLQVTFFEGTAHGQMLDYSIVVSNAGDGNAPGFWVDLFANSTQRPTQASTLDDLAWVPSLAGGASIPLTLQAPAPSTSNQSWVGVDMDGRVDEASDSNNIAGPVTIEVSAGLPDLQVVYAEALTDGDATLYEVWVSNEGESATSGFWVDLFLDPSTPPVVDDTGYTFEWVEGLAAGDIEVIEFIVDQAPDTVWNSVVFADTNAHVNESDESNNQMTVVVIP